MRIEGGDGSSWMWLRGVSEEAWTMGGTWGGKVRSLLGRWDGRDKRGGRNSVKGKGQGVLQNTGKANCGAIGKGRGSGGEEMGGYKVGGGEGGKIE